MSQTLQTSGFDAAAFKAELQRELADLPKAPEVDEQPRQVEIAAAPILAVEVISQPAPAHLRMVVHRDASGRIDYVDISERP
jgi:hypothetical protein